MAPLLSRSLAFVLGAAGAAGAYEEAADSELLARGLFEAGAGQVVQLDAAAVGEPPALLDASDEGTPVVMMHGMGDFANNPMGMVKIKKMIAEAAKTYVHSVELCSTPSKLSGCALQDQRNGFLMTMDDQVDQFARVVQADPKLKDGFNAVGFSQGNIIIRGYVHRYNNPPVRSFLSMHGTMMGVSGLPNCPLGVPGIGALCKAMTDLADLGVYSGFVQDHLAQANYFRDAQFLKEYRKKVHFLPYINNEVEGHKNDTYTSNFKSLVKLVLVMADADSMVQPKESEHFGYFEDGSKSKVVAMQDAPWYKEDWFGLKALDEAKKIDTFTTHGDHLRFTDEFLLQMVQKYFTANATTEIVV